MSNWIMGIIGLASVYYVGMRVLGLSWQDAALAVAVSNASGWFSLLLTLAAERQTWIRKHVLTRSLATWTLLAVLYFGILLAAVPALRDARVIAELALPLIFCTGFMIPLFGICQDAIVRRGQRREKERRSRASASSPGVGGPSGNGAAQRNAMRVPELG